MLVVLAIIVVITAIVFAGNTLFNRSLTLINTTYDVALSIRQAQVFGVSSRTFNATQNTGYGIHFNRTTNLTYLMYADTYPAPGNAANCHCANAACAALPDAKPGNCAYDAVYGGNQSELVTQYTLGAGVTISDFCGPDSSNTTHCANTGSSDLAALDIVFVRPNEQAILYGRTSAGASYQLSSATIYLNASGSQRCVQVTSFGQVSVLATCP